MSEKNYYILFSESDIGIHSREDNETEEFMLIKLTFPPSVEKRSDGKIVFKANLKKNKDFLLAMNSYENAMLGDYASVSILIGFDFDVSGASMAVALRENLIEYGVPESNIFYTPLTEERYMSVQKFPETEKYKKFLYLQELFRKELRASGIRKNVGFMKAISLKYSLLKRGKKVRLSSNISGINPDGSSTATVVTRDMTGEE